MSQEAFEAALTRMATDHAYSDAVQSNPDLALAGLELTADERTTLVGLTHDAGSGLTALAPRSSKSALFFGSALHDATAPVHHAVSHTASQATHTAGPSAGEQVVTWVTSMDHPGDADSTPALASGTAQGAGQAAEEEMEELEADLEGDLPGGGPLEGAPPA